MSNHSFQSAKFLKEKQLEEVQQSKQESVRLARERRMMLGYFVVSLLATLLLSGALNLF